jgi:predicted negative regulator of RcsB-dependent stress response
VEEYLSESERWEWIKAQVRENAASTILTVAVVVGAVFAYNWWQGHQDAGRLDAGAKYTQMSQALEGGDRTKALLLLGELERDHAGSPYTDQARLLAARLYVTGNDLEHAASELSTVAEHSKDHELALLARLRLARVQIAQGKPEAALASLGGVEPGAYAGRYHEVRGDAYFAKGDKAAALSEYKSAQGQDNDPLLGLKIADLSAAAPAAAPPAPGLAK